MRKVSSPVPPAVRDALVELGAGLKDLRRRRRIPMWAAADRALISRATLHKVERGDPGVSLGIYAKVLQGYGMVERLAVLAEARFDLEGLIIETRRLPGRIHRRADPPIQVTASDASFIAPARSARELR